MNWFSAPFHQFEDYVLNIDRILHLSMQGIAQVSTLPKLARALANLDAVVQDGPLAEDVEEGLKETEARATFAAAELEHGFPVLHAHSTVSLWSALEALVEDLSVAWLLNKPKILAHEEFARLKVPLAAFEAMDKEERMVFLVREHARSRNADLRAGASRFDTLLSPLGLSVPVAEGTRRLLFELSQVRNVLVHRAGVADRRFTVACPWMALEPGANLRVTHERYQEYLKAIHDYALSVMKQVYVALGGTDWPGGEAGASEASTITAEAKDSEWEGTAG